MTDVHQFPADTGVLVIGHGTRDARGQAEFLQAGEMLRARMPGVAIEVCFLELASPDIATGVGKLAAAGAGHFIAAPLLLFTAGHAKRDIPDAIVAAVQHCDEMTWQMASPLENHPAVLALSARRFREALRNIDASEEEVTLLFVGRGSSDPEAIESVHQFAAQRRDLTPVAAQQVCFLAAAKPTFADAIEWATARSPSHIVVQPHLLFHGQLIQQINAQVAAQPGRAGKAWHVAEHLGASEGLIEALHDQIRFAAIGNP